MFLCMFLFRISIFAPPLFPMPFYIVVFSFCVLVGSALFLLCMGMWGMNIEFGYFLVYCCLGVHFLVICSRISVIKRRSGSCSFLRSGGFAIFSSSSCSFIACGLLQCSIHGYLFVVFFVFFPSSVVLIVFFCCCRI